MERGHSVLTIEAAERIGGRALTDLETFGVPYDLGAHWLHRAGKNPFVKYAKNNGFRVYPAPNDEIVYVGEREASDEEYAAYEKAYQAAIRAISAAGRAGRDIGPIEVVPDGGDWHDLVHFVIGPWEMGKDFDHFSCEDWWNSEDGVDWFLRAGFRCAARPRCERHPGADRYPGHAYQMGEQRGYWWRPIAALSRRGPVLLTASTGVLANEAIVFEPPLPVAKQESFHGISMGLADLLPDTAAAASNENSLIFKARVAPRAKTYW